MVFRRNLKLNKVVIDTDKHEVRYSNLLEAGGAVRNVVIAQGKNVEDFSSDIDVKVGSVIKAIFFEMNWNVEGNITSIIDWSLVKSRSGQSGTTDFDPAVPNTPQRSQKFLWGMEMPSGINNSSSIKRIGTLLIPKGKQKMHEGDFWLLTYRYSAAGNIADSCGHFIYKEYR